MGDWTLLIDDRELDAIAWCEAHGIPYQKDMLKIADYAISQQVCYEHKRVTKTNNDVWTSVKDNRIFIQSKERHENYEINFMIIQIDPDCTPWNEWFPKEAYDHLKQDLLLTFDTHIIETHSIDESMQIMLNDLNRLQLHGLKEVPPCNKDPKPMDPRDQQLYLISSLPNFGAKLAEDSLVFFKTPLNFIKFIVTTPIVKIPSGYRALKVDRPEGLGPKIIEETQKLLTFFYPKPEKK